LALRVNESESARGRLAGQRRRGTRRASAADSTPAELLRHCYREALLCA
jgi:hypothetical protein